VSRSLCSPIQELVEEIDNKLIPETKEGSAKKTSLLPRYINLMSSITTWLNDVGWINYGDYTSFLTLPDKSLPLYFNASDQTIHALVGNLAAIGFGAYLLSFLPGSSSSHAYGSDIPFYDEDDLGYGLARDQDFKDFYDDDYDYQYPDSPDDWSFAASEAKRKRVKSDRMGGAGKRRRPNGERRRQYYQQRYQGPGLFESLTNLFMGPMERMGEAVVDPEGFVQHFAKRYDEYWQRRRGGDPARKRRRKYNAHAQYRTAEEAEVELPLFEERSDVFNQSGEEVKRQSEPWWIKDSRTADNHFSDLSKLSK